MNATKWVLIDRSKAAKTKDGATLSRAALARIAEAVTMQVKDEFTAEWGAQATVRAGQDEQDIKPGEWVYGFESVLAQAPDASAFHDLTKKGIPFALCAVTTCGSVYGSDGISVDASHEILETAGDQGANLFANDNAGWLHAIEMCDGRAANLWQGPVRTARSCRSPTGCSGPVSCPAPLAPTTT